MAQHDLSSLAPSQIDVVFPIRREELPHQDVHVESVTLSSLDIPQYTGIQGNGTSHDLFTTLVADEIGSDFTNQSELTALAQRWARDYYLWLLADAHVSYRGVLDNWDPTGLEDMEVRHDGRGIQTVLCRPVINEAEVQQGFHESAGVGEVSAITLDGDGTITSPIRHDAGTGSPFYTHCNDAPDGLSVDYVENDDNNTDGTATFTLTDMPSNFASMTTLSITVDVQATDFLTDSATLTCRIYEDDTLTTPLSDESAALATQVDATRTQRTVELAGLTGDKAQWDGAYILFTWDYTLSGGDGGNLQLYGMSLSGTYGASHPSLAASTVFRDSEVWLVNDLTHVGSDLGMSYEDWPAWSGDEDDFAQVGNEPVKRMSSSTSVTLSGIVPRREAQVIVLYNAGENDIVLAHESTSSSAENRFNLSDSVDVTLSPNGGLILWHDPVTDRWRPSGCCIEEVAIVEITGPKSGCYYPGQRVRFVPATCTWTVVEIIWIVDANE